MNKTMEYMAYGLAVLVFNLSETRVSAGDAAAYAEPNGVEGYGDLLVALLDDEPRRRQMGERGRARVVERLAWSRQSPAYVGVFDALVPAGSVSLAQVPG
jgi:asparagine synthase (glutamine-hydrolysing)